MLFWEDVNDDEGKLTHIDHFLHSFLSLRTSSLRSRGSVSKQSRWEDLFICLHLRRLPVSLPSLLPFFLGVYLSLSIYLFTSISLPVCLPSFSLVYYESLYRSISFCLHLSVCQFTFLPSHLSITSLSIDLSPSVYLYLYLFFLPSFLTCQSTSFSINLSLSVYFYLYLFVCPPSLPVYLPVCLPLLYLSVCLLPLLGNTLPCHRIT